MATNVLAWSDKNDRALAIIGLGLGDNYIHHLDLNSTADIVWEKINEQFGKDLNNSVVFLKQRFFKMNVLQATSLKNHLQNLSLIIQQLTALKAPPSDDDKKAVLLNSFEESPAHTEILHSLCTSRNMNYEEMVAILIDEDRRHSNNSLNDEKAMAVKFKIPASSSRPKPSTSSSIPICTYCKKPGHTASCYYKRLEDLDGADKAHLVVDQAEEEEQVINECAHMVIYDDDDSVWAL